MIPASFSTDPFMSRKCIPNEYNCFDFADEVWLAITGHPLKDRLAILRTDIAARRALVSDRRGFKLLERPAEPSLVMFRNPYSVPHVGVYLRSKILHLYKDSGVLFERLDNVSFRFRKTSFYQ